ncbi:hypothetical protein [Sansalvadorimonas verongulae]|uniref:hypothetical protein n=1 Tax=Sansalvadorimonas verongulae TaxID=2172824 RepID=UPI0012BD3603|nr:hypothetical protein [Sansalvadorimonas verongulae]MTI13008.1 hypothetical protein [Sansalvadorimonas verongulae]
MQIDLSLDQQLHTLIEDFHNAPAKTDTAIRRAMTKLSRFAERQVLRALSRSTSISQKKIKELGRVRVSLHRPGQKSDQYELVIWVGLADIPAHYLGRPIQTKSGVRTGRYRWYGAFVFQPVNARNKMVFQRTPEWKHKKQVSLKSGRTMWMGLPIEKVSLPIANSARQAVEQLQPKLLERFTTLMQQELNYVYRIE